MTIIEKVPTRNGFGKGLIIAGEKDSRVVALSADLSESTRVEGFKKRFPERYIEVGVAEQNMASLAAGMALAGKIPFISSYAVFSPGRNLEQIRTTIALNNVNVKIAGCHAGLATGPDGATHQALEDVALMRTMPNMQVIVPCDTIEARKATIAAAGIVSSVYLRLFRPATPVLTKEDSPFKVGKANVLLSGKDVTIVSSGPLLHEALVAAEILKTHGIQAEVINNHTIKPLDERTLLESVKKTRALVTVEDHQQAGGMGSAIVEMLAQKLPVPVEMVGVRDCFGGSGEPEELWEMYELTHPYIIKAAKRVMKRKA